MYLQVLVVCMIAAFHIAVLALCLLKYHRMEELSRLLAALKAPFTQIRFASVILFVAVVHALIFGAVECLRCYFIFTFLKNGGEVASVILNVLASMW